MASFNGNIGTPSGGFNLKVEYSISQSVSGNYSDVTATGYVKRNNSSYKPYNSSSSSSLTINGTSKSYTGSYDLRSDGYKSIVSNTVRVYHNNDGTKSITISFSFNGKLSSYYPNGSISQTITLPTIPRQANISTAPDFNDEENPTITYSNPAGNSVSSLDACISLTGSKDDVPYRSINKTGTLSYTFNLTEEERNTLRKATTTNSRSVIFHVRTGIGGNTYYSTLTRTFKIVNGNPVFDDFVFEDVNQETLELTGNNQNIIAGYSDVKVTIPVANKAIAQKQATMSKYRFNSIDANYSDTNDVSITSNKVTNGDFTVYAIDSRGNSTSKTKNALNVVNYTPLQKGNITLNRENGVSENVVLNFDATIDLVDFGTKINSVTSVQYRYKVASETEWSELENITVQVDDNGKITFNSLIKGDTETFGFNIQNAYNIEVYLKDELSEVKYIANFGAGIPHIAYAKNGVGIMGAYDESVGGLLQVGGKKITNIGQMIRVYNTTAQTINPNTLTKLNFNTIKDNTSDSLTFEDNKIIIGKGVRTVLVNGRWTIWGTYGKYIYVYQNGKSYSFSMSTAGTIETSVVLPVEEGDYIELFSYHENSSDVTIANDQNQTFLQVTILG